MSTSAREDRLARIRTERLAQLGTLLAGFAHEVRNPLSTISLNLQLVLEEFRDPETPRDKRTAKRVATVEAEVRRLQKILEEFLSFARAPEPKIEPVLLNQRLQAVVDFHEPELRERQVSLRFYPGSDVGAVPADWDHVQAAVVNLVRNAKEATPPGGEILVSTVREGAFVLIRVTDTGAGIPPELQPRVFDPYYSTKKSGTGPRPTDGPPGRRRTRWLAHAGVRGRQGHPVHHAPASAAARRRRCAARRWHGTTVMTKDPILVVDDDDALRESLAEALAALPVEITVASGGAEAVALLAERRFAVVVTDLVMKGVDGFAVLAAAKQSYPNCRVVMLTGHGGREVAVQAMEKGATYYVEKPVDLADLRAKVKQVARGPPEGRRLRRPARPARAHVRDRGHRRPGPEDAAHAGLVRQIAGTAASVLILGPVGHGQGTRRARRAQPVAARKKPFVAINCGGMSEGTIESELFGHVKGAFTGRRRRSRGQVRIRRRRHAAARRGGRDAT
jgi:CheY-like chemotaxis protein/two-component sensor histidine kinase